jgi:hypothetical protein
MGSFASLGRRSGTTAPTSTAFGAPARGPSRAPQAATRSETRFAGPDLSRVRIDAAGARAPDGLGRGTPLDAATRSEMEGLLGAAGGGGPRGEAAAEDEADRVAGDVARGSAGSGRGRVDLDDVRIHTGAAAAAAARARGARAYSIGPDVVFGDGQLDLASRDGRSLLAHELAHVVQWKRGDGDDGRLVVRRKGYTTPQLLDPTDKRPQAERVTVANDDELKEARRIYAKIKKAYGVTLDSSTALATYEKRAGTDRLPFPTEVKSWTLQELRAIDEALGYFEPLINEDARKLGRPHPERIGRAQFRVPTSPNPLLQQAEPDLGGQNFGDDIVLFNALSRSPSSAVRTIVHELGHNVFGSLTSEFLQHLPYWKDFSTHVDLEKMGGDNDLIPGLTEGLFEPPMRGYGSKNVGEDIADSVMFYFLDPVEFKRQCPRRFAIIDRKFKQEVKAIRAQARPSGSTPVRP